MKHLYLLVMLCMLTLFCTAQKNNILKQKKIPIYKNKESLINVNKAPKPAIIEGVIVHVNNRWNVRLSDNTYIQLAPDHTIYVQKKFDLNNLSQKKVHVKGELYIGAITVTNERVTEKTYWGYKIDVEKINLVP